MCCQLEQTWCPSQNIWRRHTAQWWNHSWPNSYNRQLWNQPLSAFTLQLHIIITIWPMSGPQWLVEKYQIGMPPETVSHHSTKLAQCTVIYSGWLRPTAVIKKYNRQYKYMKTHGIIPLGSHCVMYVKKLPGQSGFPLVVTMW